MDKDSETILSLDNDATEVLKLDSEITFSLDNGATEVLRLDPNGDFYVKGNKVANDIEVYQVFKEWLGKAAFKQE